MGSHCAVVAFPTLPQADSIEAVRQKFDPQASLLAAHVTVVFPFEDDDAEADLADHVRASVSGMAPFEITLTSISREPDGYLFLNVGAGADRLHQLHRTLYDGRLAKYQSQAHTYRPHVTVARITDDNALAHAHREASLTLRLPMMGTVSGLAIFRLDAPNHGAVIHEVAFAG